MREQIILKIFYTFLPLILLRHLGKLIFNWFGLDPICKSSFLFFMFRFAHPDLNKRSIMINKFKTK